jgi:integrase/recombinase XerD
MSKKSNRMRKTLERYLDIIATTRRRNTLYRYRSAGLNFIRYLESHHRDISHLSSLKRSHIENWLRHLWKKKLKPGSRRSVIISVRRFLEDIATWGWKNAPVSNLFESGDAPAEEDVLPRALTPEADQAIQKQLKKMDNIYANSLLFLRYTGLRISELRNLELESLKELPDGQWLLLVPLGKLHNERVIPVDDTTAEIFQKIKRMRGLRPPRCHPETGKETHFLLIHRKNQRISAGKLRRVLRQAKRNAGLKDEVTPHMLRHTYATSLTRGGIRLPVLKELMGHRSIRMTLRYVKVTQVDIQSQYHIALKSLKNRYKIPKPKHCSRPEKLKPTVKNILQLLETIASLMETFRRDMKQAGRKKRIQRLIERVKRLSQDFRDLAL